MNGSWNGEVKGTRKAPGRRPQKDEIKHSRIVQVVFVARITVHEVAGRPV